MIYPNMNKKPVILIFGAGAVGGIMAGILKDKGYDVTLIAKHEDLAKKISDEGLEISGYCGSIKTIIPTVANVTQIRRRPDYVLLAIKAPDMPEAAKVIRPLLIEESLVVSMQNGIVEEELASIVGKDRTVGCVTGWGATLLEDNKMEMTSSGEFVIGYLDRQPDERLNELASVLENILPVNQTDKILENLYSKLIINSCVSTVGAICGLPLGKMLRKKMYRSLFLDIIREAIHVADAMQITVPDYAGKLNYYKLLKSSKLFQHTYLRLFGYKYRRLKSSSLQSLERGKKTEVRYFNGYIASKGMELGVPTPVNSRMVDLVEEIEAGNRSISPGNFN